MGKGLVGRFGVNKLVIFALAGGVVALGLDSWVGHFLANGDEASKPQWIPILLAPATFLLLVVALFGKGGLERWSLRISGAVNLLLGLAGTFFHFKSLMGEFKGEAYTWHNLTGALGVAPPTFAPAGFAAVGLVAIILASPRFSMRWSASPEAASQPAGAPQGLAVDDG